SAAPVAGPLAGVRVVEATTTVAGPMCGCVLADLGADVIKIELPGGEVVRRLPPFLPGTDPPLSFAHAHVNRNKRSLCLDLLADDLGGLHGAIAVLAALHHRSRSGEGQHLDVALLDSLLFQSDGFLTVGAMGFDYPRLGNEYGFAAPANVYEAKDGRVYIGVLLDAHWKVLAGVLGRPDLADGEYAAIPGR